MKFFHRWADKSLREENERLRHQLRERDSEIRIKDLEIQQLAAVSARNLKRVEAETAIAAKRIAVAENVANNVLSSRVAL